jgi:hypothetical protein
MEKIFKSEVNFVSSKDRASLIIYSLGIIYFFLGLRFYISSYNHIGQIAHNFPDINLVDQMTLYFYYPFLKDTNFEAVCKIDNPVWCKFSEQDALVAGSLILISTYVIRWILTKKFNPLPWK